jgi:hypothetical protein
LPTPQQSSADDSSAEGIVATAIDRVSNYLGDGLSSGASDAALAAGIWDILDASDQADLVATTEARGSFIDAKLGVYNANSADLLYYDSGEHCPICTVNQSVSPIGIDDSWPSGDPPVHPNCTCDVFATPPGN